MRSSYPQVPVLALFLLLVLPSPLVSRRAFQHRVPNRLSHLSQASRDHHNGRVSPGGESDHLQRSKETLVESETEKPCQGDLDIYFILDKSGGVGNNWLGIYNFVEKVLGRFQNPQTRVSFITYSTLGDTILKLTSDKEKIQKGLKKLQNVMTKGATNMYTGLQQANQQIRNAARAGRKRLSLLVVLTDKALLPRAFQAAMMQAKDTHDLGGIVYTVGLGDYKRDQLRAIAGTEKRVFGVNLKTNERKGIEDIAAPLAAKACIEITVVDPSNFCAGEKYDVLVYGKGFSNAQDRNRVVCHFKISESRYYDQKATSVEDTSLKCPGVEIDEANQNITLEISLNGGISFISSHFGITSRACMRSKVNQRMTVSLSGVSPMHTAPVNRNIRKALGRGSELPIPLPLPIPNIGIPGLSSLSLPGSRAEPTKTVPTFEGSIKFPETNLYLILAVVFLALLLISCGIYHFICRRSRDRCLQACPTMVFPPAGNPDGNIRHLEDKLDSICNIIQLRNQRPVIICPTKCKDRCSTSSPFRGRCGRMPNCSNICRRTNPEFCPVSNCWPRCLQCPRSCSRSQQYAYARPPQYICTRPPQPICARHPQITCSRYPSKMFPCSTRSGYGVPLPLPSP